MKKIIFLFVFAAFSFLSSASFSQMNIQLFQEKTQDIITPDAYPLIEGKTENLHLERLKNFNMQPYTNPGFALPPMNWDYDPGMLLIPIYKNCDPGMVYWERTNPEKPVPTFETYMPPSLDPNSFVSPFLLPGADPFLKWKELQDAGKLHLKN